ncbi:glutathione S-transferase family protein [Natranaeroarchaeum aerophilus]|uniref:Glutathione S-transferase family protein n=1 Tax=Natranaeroarchaeum aerophilus TaxID=2917711 RepID=A0AAE3K711_9EURY|nr:glutathione S-transferase family protein [Natranaeroarchaeum aerophilus]MCL9814945.1 glutathione S-transferase family protein [Natranaeroarchaeum aerophilus]
MHMLLDGKWTRTAFKATDDSGAFQRQKTSFREHVSANSDAEFPAEPGRYHLYVSKACPWAHRTLITRALKGLEDVVSVDVVDPIRIVDGWRFRPEKDDCTPDTVNGTNYLRDVYTAADDSFTGRVTVPVLWDTERETVVNNESAEIMRMLDTAFHDLGERDVDLYPDGYRDEVDRVMEAIYDPINNGVYRAGFAKSQEAHEEATTELFDALDHWDDVLADQRYLTGDVLTEADIAMFTTLVRFDEVYHTHFKCNVARISDYENLWGYLRELYQLPGVAETVNMDHIKQHYYVTHDDINPTGLVPVGPDPDFEAPHNRDELAGGPPDALL